MSVAVIGGAGFIGSHLVDELLVQGHEVMVVDDLSTGTLDNLCRWKGNSKLDFARVDVRSPGLLARVCDHKTWVFSFVTPLLELPAACLAAGVRRLMRNGSTHWNSPAEVISSGCCVIRCDTGSVYGPRGPKQGWLFVSDIVRANVLAAMNPWIDGEIYLGAAGSESLGWKPLIDQATGQAIIEMYEKANYSMITVVGA
jgi:NAD(P)-dependent dehydrogenase (short-subunit alcohol dehydrogenase family)